MLVLEFIFRALPHIFRAKSIQPPPKNGPYTYEDIQSVSQSDTRLLWLSVAAAAAAAAETRRYIRPALQLTASIQSSAPPSVANSLLSSLSAGCVCCRSLCSDCDVVTASVAAAHPYTCWTQSARLTGRAHATQPRHVLTTR